MEQVESMKHLVTVALVLVAAEASASYAWQEMGLWTTMTGDGSGRSESSLDGIYDTVTVLEILW